MLDVHKSAEIAARGVGLALDGVRIKLVDGILINSILFISKRFSMIGRKSDMQGDHIQDVRL